MLEDWHADASKTLASFLDATSHDIVTVTYQCGGKVVDCSVGARFVALKMPSHAHAVIVMGGVLRY